MVPKIREGVRARAEEFGALVFTNRTPILALNGDAFAVWKLIDGTRTDGDIIAATSTVPGLDIAHTGIALWRDGRLHLLHAPLAGGVVQISEVPLAERIQRIRGQDGVMVARPTEVR